MTDPDPIIRAIADSDSWDARVTLIRRIPEQFGTGQQTAIYAALAEQVYSPSLTAEFAYVHWRDEYKLEAIEEIYQTAIEETRGFTRIAVDDLTGILERHPRTLRIFRLLLGFTVSEFAQASEIVASSAGLPVVGVSAVKSIEEGRHVTQAFARTCATVIDLAMRRALLPSEAQGRTARLKIDKPDTAEGWATVQRFALDRVPLATLLHQRFYGGAFRQLLDATSNARGDMLEDPFEQILVREGIPYIRTGARNQAMIEHRFGVTVKPAPDFVIYDNRNDALRAIIECKVANDGGTARDKAARFRALRAEANRLGGVPLFALLGGIGWRRTADALGPVVRDTDGRTFTIANLEQMLTIEPFPALRGLVEAEPH